MFSLNIKSKIIFGFGIVILMILVSVIVLMQTGTRLSKYTRFSRDISAKYIEIANQIKIDIIQIQQWLTYVSATRGNDVFDDGFKEAKDSYESLLAGLEQFKVRYTKENNNEEVNQIKKIKEHTLVYYEIGIKMANTYITGNEAEGNKYMREFDKSAEELNYIITPFIKAHTKEFKSSLDSIESLTRKISLLMGGASIFCVFFCVLSMIIIINSISKPILMCKNYAEKVGMGNFKENLTLYGKDEFSKLGQSLQSMAHQIQKLVAESKKKVELLDAVNAPILGIDVNYTVTHINKAGAELVNKTPKECIGMKCYDFFNMNGCKTEKCILKQIVNKNKKVSIRTIAKTKANVELPIMCNGVPIRDQKGTIVGIVEYIIDMTNIDRVQKSVKMNSTTVSCAIDGLTLLADSMKEKTTAISKNSNDVASAAEEMSSNMGTIANKVKKAQVNMNIASSSSEEMAATVKNIAANTEKARSVTTNAVSTVDSMEKQLSELGETSNSIGSVINTIVEIAEQTKLLALNATIEAARAGEAGKGFAVVAVEVKDLAKQTNDATVDIREKIEKMAGATHKTIGEISGIDKIIKDINDIVTHIASAVEEQSVTTNDIATNIGNVNKDIKDISLSISESATASVNIASNITKTNADASDIRNSASQIDQTVHMFGDVCTNLTEEVKKLDS